MSYWQSPPLVPYHVGLFMVLLTVWKHASTGRTSDWARESTSETEVMVFCNLITEETAFIFAIFTSLEAGCEVQPILKGGH